MNIIGYYFMLLQIFGEGTLKDLQFNLPRPLQLLEN
jgi:hypothetical protein